MKICICCSLSFTKEVLQVAKELETLGHEVLLPNGVINHLAEQPDYDPVKTKIETDPVHAHTDKIRASYAVLVCNYSKNGIKHYIGANSFAEMFVAKYFNKPIFTLYALPDQPYIHDEIHGFEPKILDGNLSRLVN